MNVKIIFENREKKGRIYFLVIGIMIAIGAIVWIVFGARSIVKGMFIFFEILLVFGTLFLLAYLFWYLFIKKSKFDVNYVNKQKIMDACARLKRPILKDLYVSGDKGWTRSKVGKIKGICRISVPTRNYIYDDIIDPKDGHITKKLRTTMNERQEQIAEYEIGSVEQDCFRIKSGLFQEDMIIRVNPEDHTQLIGDVNLFGFSLIPISEYWFLNNDHLDVRKIDYAILKEAERTVAFVTMTDLKEIVDKATGVDARHKKIIEGKSLVEVPETSRVGQPQTPY